MDRVSNNRQTQQIQQKDASSHPQYYHKWSVKLTIPKLVVVYGTGYHNQCRADLISIGPCQKPGSPSTTLEIELCQELRLDCAVPHVLMRQVLHATRHGFKCYNNIFHQI